jgi:diguanylate cyclase (GGDEF)-like protein
MEVENMPDDAPVPATGPQPLVDHLTGLPNRRALASRLEELTRGDGPFGLLFVELDGLAELNRTGGTRMGDRAIMEFARLLSESLRENDAVFRYGGDQFVILSPGLRPGNEVGPGQRILRQTEGLLPEEWGVSASIGQSLFPGDSESGPDLMALAGMAARSAKDSGGGRMLRWREGHDLFWHREVFTGRRGLLAELHSRLYPGRECALVILTGESGAGKTTLLETAVEKLPPDVRVVRLAGSPELARVPYATVLAAVRQAAGELGLPDIDPVMSNVLSGLLPDIFPRREEAALPPLEKFVLMDALTEVLGAWTPAVLVADGAQWLDDATVSLLSYALGRDKTTDMSVCCAMRAEDMESPEPPPAAELVDHPLAAVMEVPPMSEEEVRGLARSRLGAESVSDRLAGELMEVSGGIPLLATEHLRTLNGAGLLRLNDERSLYVGEGHRPATGSRIRSFVRSRLKRLSEDDLRLLALAATMGRCFDVATVAGLAALKEGQVLSCFDRAESLGLLRACPDPMRFELAASYLREGLLSRLSQGLRSTFHEAVADMYRRSGDRAMAAVHLEAAGNTGDALEERMAVAGELRASGLVGVAAEHLAASVRLLESRPEQRGGPSRLAEAALKTARTCTEAGMHHRSRSFALRAAEAAKRAGRKGLRARALLSAASSLRLMDEAGRALVELDRIGTTGNPDLDGCVRLERVDVLTRLGRCGEAERELEGLSGDSFGIPSGMLAHKRALIRLGRLDLAGAAEATSAAIRAASDSPETGPAPWWLFYDHAETCLYAGRVSEARRAASRAVESAERSLSLWGSIWGLLALARANTRALRPGRATGSVRRAAELAERTDDPEAIAGAQLAECLLLTACGDASGALGMLHRAGCWAVIDPLVLGFCRTRIDLLAGRAAEAREGAAMVADALDSRTGPLELASFSVLCRHDVGLLVCEARLPGEEESVLKALGAMDLEDYPRGRLWRARIEARALAALGREEAVPGRLRMVLSDGRTRTETLERLLVYRDVRGLLPEAGRRLKRLRRRLEAGCPGSGGGGRERR